MILTGKKILDEFKQKHPDAVSHTNTWVAVVEGANWTTPHDIKARYAKATILPEKYVIFNILGGAYRIKVLIDYIRKIVLVTNAGTHTEYDRW